MLKRILIVEDHTLLRESLRALLSAAPDLEIVGEARDGQEALQQSKQLIPDIVLMDLSMPNKNGTEAIGVIKKYNPDIKIIVLTIHKSDEYVRSALDAGADGYVLKDDSQHELMSAINCAQEGKVYLSPGISDMVIHGFLNHGTNASPAHSRDKLTVREQEIIKLIAEGKKTREIAEYLSISIKTVEKHRTNIKKKLDLHSVSGITAYAISSGLTTPSLSMIKRS